MKLTMPLSHVGFLSMKRADHHEGNMLAETFWKLLNRLGYNITLDLNKVSFPPLISFNGVFISFTKHNQRLLLQQAFRKGHNAQLTVGRGIHTILNSFRSLWYLSYPFCHLHQRHKEHSMLSGDLYMQTCLEWFFNWSNWLQLLTFYPCTAVGLSTAELSDVLKTTWCQVKILTGTEDGTTVWHFSFCSFSWQLTRGNYFSITLINPLIPLLVQQCNLRLLFRW